MSKTLTSIKEVAEEVRKLAEESARAASQVNNLMPWMLRLPRGLARGGKNARKRQEEFQKEVRKNSGSSCLPRKSVAEFCKTDGKYIAESCDDRFFDKIEIF